MLASKPKNQNFRG